VLWSQLIFIHCKTILLDIVQRWLHQSFIPCNGVIILLKRKQFDFRVKELPDLLACFVAVHDRHIQVKQYDINALQMFVLLDELKSLLPILSLEEHFKARLFQIRSSNLQLEFFIVGDNAGLISILVTRVYALSILLIKLTIGSW